MSKEDGGQAFPVGGVMQGDGMSLRDWYAGMALQGLIAHGIGDKTDQIVAEVSYMVADAMLKARGS